MSAQQGPSRRAGSVGIQLDSLPLGRGRSEPELGSVWTQVQKHLAHDWSAVGSSHHGAVLGIDAPWRFVGDRMSSRRVIRLHRVDDDRPIGRLDKQRRLMIDSFGGDRLECLSASRSIDLRQPAPHRLALIRTDATDDELNHDFRLDNPRAHATPAGAARRAGGGFATVRRNAAVPVRRVRLEREDAPGWLQPLKRTVCPYARRASLIAPTLARGSASVVDGLRSGRLMLQSCVTGTASWQAERMTR